MKRHTFPVRITGAVVVSFLIILALFITSRHTAAAPPAHPGATATPAAMGVPQPARYAALLAKARQGLLQETYGEPPAATTRGAPVFALPPANDVGANTFQGSYRAAAKTSFASGPAQTFQDLNAVFGPLPDDSQMAQQFPALLQKTNNATARVPLEKKNIKVAAWIYWLAPESDHDFHVILGNTAQLTSTTVFMNSEVSGLPKANPSQSPFPQRRTDLRAILTNHQNVNGLFNPPVAVNVTGSLLWDGEHPSPHNVGPNGLRPKKAWEIHPINQLTER